jgi:hypothetical protein
MCGRLLIRGITKKLTPLVSLGLAFLDVQPKKVEPTEEGDDHPKEVPTALTYIVKTTYCYCQSGQNEQDAEEVYHGNEGYDETKQCEPPVFRTCCATAECYVLAEASLN